MLVCFNLLSNKQYVVGDYSTLIRFKLLSAKQSYGLGDCPILDITTYILSLLQIIHNIGYNYSFIKSMFKEIVPPSTLSSCQDSADKQTPAPRGLSMVSILPQSTIVIVDENVKVKVKV